MSRLSANTCPHASNSSSRTNVLKTTCVRT